MFIQLDHKVFENEIKVGELFRKKDTGKSSSTYLVSVVFLIHSIYVFLKFVLFISSDIFDPRKTLSFKFRLYFGEIIYQH